jgi:hypothetical protein
MGGKIMYFDDYEQEYYEPTLADEILVEYLEKMKGALLDTVKGQIEHIKRENEELKAQNKILKDKENDIRNRERDLENQKRDLMWQVKRERLGELMKDFEVVMYRAYSSVEKLPKCSKCNDKRQIEFTTPLGKRMYESCECDKGKTVYIPQEHICKEFRLDSNNNTLLMWFKENHDKEYDWYSYESSNLVRTVYKDGMNYADLDCYDTYFKSKEECQKYCDWKNKNSAEIILEGEPPYGKK